MTDNRTRTVAEVRHAFSKFGGNLGTDGSVAFQFKSCGQFLFAPGTSEDKLMEVAIDAGADDAHDTPGTDDADDTAGVGAVTDTPSPAAPAAAVADGENRTRPGMPVVVTRHPPSKDQRLSGAAPPSADGPPGAPAVGATPGPGAGA